MAPLLGYCTNVHPGEALADLVAIARGPAARVRRLLGEHDSLPVGLWLPREAAAAIAGDARAADRLRGALADGGLVAFTANAFPIGGFHAARVKEAVYRPTWVDPARRDFTVLAARALARLLPEGARGSVSTSPISFRPFADEAGHALAGWHLGQVAAELLALERCTGHELSLALEPEPGCTLETAADLVRFLEAHVYSGAGRDALVATSRRDAGPTVRGLSPGQAELELRRLVGACLDACHHAVAFEPLARALARYEAAGVRVVKAQLSAAPIVDDVGDAAARARLAAFAEPRWLHQTAALVDGERVAWTDLDEALGPGGVIVDPRVARARALVVHCHVPLAWPGDGGVGTTRGDLARALGAIAAVTDHLEVETYTFDVLPAADRARWGNDVAAMTADEVRWARRALE